MFRHLSRKFLSKMRFQGASSIWACFLLALLSSFHPEPAFGDQTGGGMRRVVVKSRPYTEEHDEKSIFGSPPTFIPYKRNHSQKK